MSFLTAADVADLTDVNQQGLATLEAIKGPIDVVFSRWSPAQQDYISLPPQRVVIRYADRQEQVISTESGEAVVISGWITGFVPFDVEPKDLFAIGVAGDEELARIVDIRPAQLGTQRASFRKTLGEL